MWSVVVCGGLWYLDSPLQTGHRHKHTLELLQDVLIGGYRLLCPVKDVLQPWINNKTKSLSRRKKRAYRRAKKSGKPAEDVTRYKQLQKDTQYQSKKAYSSYINNMVSEGSSAKKLFSFINGKRCESSVVSVLKRDGISHSDPKEKATILNEQFGSLASPKRT